MSKEVNDQEAGSSLEAWEENTDDYELVELSAGEVLHRKDPAVYIVLSGLLHVSVKSDAKSIVKPKPGPLYSLHPGESMGLGALVGGAVTWQEWFHPKSGLLRVEGGSEGVCLARVPELALFSLFHSHPSIVLSISRLILPLIRPLVWHLGLAIECLRAPAGVTLFSEGDACDSMYVVLYGRLRVSQGRKTHKHREENTVWELTRGETIGAPEILVNDGVHSGTMRAVRDSDLSQINGGAISVLMAGLPSATMGFARSIASGGVSKHNTREAPLVAVIVPLSSTYPKRLFSKTLEAALTKSCDARVLSSECIDRELCLSQVLPTHLCAFIIILCYYNTNMYYSTLF